MGVTEIRVENSLARLSGELTFATVTGLYRRMSDLARRDGMPSAIDLSEVSRIDSAGLALLLEWQSAFQRQSARTDDGTDGAEDVGGDLLEIHHPPQALLKIARLCDAEAYLTTTPGDRAVNEEQQ